MVLSSTDVLWDTSYYSYHTLSGVSTSCFKACACSSFSFNVTRQYQLISTTDLPPFAAPYTGVHSSVLNWGALLGSWSSLPASFSTDGSDGRAFKTP